MREFISNEIENLESDIIALAVTYRENCDKMVAELKEAIDRHKECLLKNKVIIRKKMDEIIDSVAADYPVESFPNPTAQETNKLPYDTRRYIGRVCASMVRWRCGQIKKELKQYFEEINDKDLNQ